jgi:hypothetical protein
MSDLTRVQLTDDEIVYRARKLAQRLHDRELLVDEHKEAKETEKAALKALDREIKFLADAVRTGVEDREKQIGMFP